MAPIAHWHEKGERPKKKALLTAVVYKELYEKYPNENPPLKLNGTHKDPDVLEKLLVDKYGYDKGDIVILMDDGVHVRPTRENMIKAMHGLVGDAQPGDHFVFHFSGHGSQVECTNGTEDDGMDEVIWPVDVEYDPSKPDDEKVLNYIIDDDLKKILVDKLPPDAHLTVLLDCCHSGTGLDLPHNHSDDSLDHEWASPVDTQAPTIMYDFNGPEMEDKAKAIPELGMSIDTVTCLSRSSTMTAKGSELKRNVKGISQSMRMPHRTRGVVISRKTCGKPVIRDEAVSVDERSLPANESERLAHATSWSACLDSQLGLDSDSGGILTYTFDALLRQNHLRSNRGMLEALSHELFRQAKIAKRYFKEHDYGELPQPKPCLGSLRPLDDILDEPFTF